MNLVHVHLLLNHIPTIGFGFGLALFLVSVFGKSDDLKKASFVAFFIVAVLAIPTYFSGNAAEAAVRDLPGVSMSAINAHEDAALVAFTVMEITGFLSWLALWQLRRNTRLAGWNVPAVLLCSLVTFGLMARAANMGGEIRHPEILPSPAAAAAAAAETQEAGGSALAKGIGLLVNAHTWIWPASETLHFIGLCVLFIVVLLVNLRMLGMARSVSFAAVYQLLPLGILGFGVNLVTGMLFFLASPGQYIDNISFHWKIALVVLAGLNVLYFMLFDKAWAVKSGDDAPLTAKLVAGSSIFLWVGVLYFGHMLPFIGNAF